MKAFMRGRSGSDADDSESSGAPLGLLMTPVVRGTTRGGKAPNRKLAKILGEDVSAISLATVPAPIPVSAAAPIIQETPWYLSEDFASEDIVFDDRGGVKAGTIDALVARLTPHGSTGGLISQPKPNCVDGG
jgi:son of sevenless-like protein